MASGIKVTIDLDESQAIRALKSLENQLGKTSSDVEKKTKKMDNALSSFLGNLAAIAAVRAFDFLKQQVFDAFNAFQQFEQGLINVTKTANLTTEETEQLSDAIKQLSREIPASTSELLDIATAAGQLGVTGVKNITVFTDTVAKLGRVSDLQGGEAATTLTRILNVTNENISTIDTFGSVIVSLGNNFAATESEIALVTNEVARATAQFGVSASEAAALSTTLRSVGVRAEEAGGVLSNTFIKIDEAIRGGGASLQQLEKITGLTGDQIRKQFSEDAIGLFRNFSAGLQRIGEEGGNVNAALEALDIKGIRVSKVLPVLAKNTSEFDRALALARDEITGVSNALEDEFNKGLQSSISQTKLFQNAVDRATTRLGEKFAGALSSILPFITEYVDKLGKSDIEIFAQSTEDVERLRKEVAIYQNQIEQLKKDSFLPDFLKADIDETSQKIQVLQNRINDINSDKAKNALSGFRNELKTLQDFLADTTPQGDAALALFGGREQAQKRANELKEIIAQNNRESLVLIKDAEKEKTRTVVEEVENRKTILDELREVERAEAFQRKEEAKLLRQIESEEQLQFLADNLGKENAARELARIQNISNEKKRQEELLKLKEKANEQEKASLLNLRKFENLTNQQKVQAQRDTLQTIATLGQSNNDFLFNIGKASSLTLAGINTAEGVTKALAAFPPPFNFAAAAAVGAAGAVQIANIASAKKPSAGSFQDGGIVGGSSFSGDRLQANVNSGEVIFNRRQQENLFNAVDSGNLGGGPSVTINNPLLLEQGAVDALIDQINDALEFRNKELGAVS